MDIALGTRFRSEYRYSENTRKSAIGAAPLFRVNSEFVRHGNPSLMYKMAARKGESATGLPAGQLAYSPAMKVPKEKAWAVVGFQFILWEEDSFKYMRSVQ